MIHLHVIAMSLLNLLEYIGYRLLIVTFFIALCSEEQHSCVLDYAVWALLLWSESHGLAMYEAYTLCNSWFANTRDLTRLIDMQVSILIRVRVNRSSIVRIHVMIFIIMSSSHFQLTAGVLLPNRISRNEPCRSSAHSRRINPNTRPLSFCVRKFGPHCHASPIIDSLMSLWFFPLFKSTSGPIQTSRTFLFSGLRFSLSPITIGLARN